LLDEGAVCCHDGAPLPSWLLERLRHECARLELVAKQLKALEASTVTDLPKPVRQDMRTLLRLRGVGPVSAFRLTTELFWRKFNNRREVGACVGLVPQPYDSGQSRVDQGISKQGNRRVRSLLIEMAWMWLRHQPASAITKWFAQRTQGIATAPGAGKRGRRIAIVAVARRLVIALWKYLIDGVIPEGATLKMAA
jgi:transposase